MFDVAPTEQSEVRLAATLPIEEREWNIGLIVGPSGCGKSTLAREMFGESMVHGYEWPDDKSIVDAFPKEMGIKDITGLLSSVGFSSPPAWLRPFRVLSNGEQFRVTMARALAESPDLAVMDEFTSVVDRTVAQVGSAAIAKSVRRRGAKFIAVSCHYDIVEWLDPDWTYEPATDEFHWRSERGRPPIQLEVERVSKKAWSLFSHHHYLSSTLSSGAMCFMGCINSRPAVFTAVMSFAHPRVPSWREHRTVCLPDFQGVGVGNAMSELIASAFAIKGKPYISVTGHPGMIRHRIKSQLWKCKRAPSMIGSSGQNGQVALMRGKPGVVTNSYGRITSGFQFIGKPNRESAEALGIAR